MRDFIETLKAETVSAMSQGEKVSPMVIFTKIDNYLTELENTKEVETKETVKDKKTK